METFLAIALGASLIINIALIATMPKVVTISDVKPEKASPKNDWLQLQNEGKKYVKEKDGKVYLKIVK